MTLRTINKAYEELRARDPETAITRKQKKPKRARPMKSATEATRRPCLTITYLLWFKMPIPLLTALTHILSRAQTEATS